jgi:hypothetical protein
MNLPSGRVDDVHTPNGLEALRTQLHVLTTLVMSYPQEILQRKQAVPLYMRLWMELVAARGWDVPTPYLIEVYDTPFTRGMLDTSTRSGLYSARVRLTLTNPSWRPVGALHLLEGPPGTRCAATLELYDRTFVRAFPPKMNEWDKLFLSLERAMESFVVSMREG